MQHLKMIENTLQIIKTIPKLDGNNLLIGL